MSSYWRPLLSSDPCRPREALTLAGGWLWFDRLERIERGGASEILSVASAPSRVLDRLTASHAPVAGVSMAVPQVMGILNVTPDSFSDGGRFAARQNALARGIEMAKSCAFLDIGGESTRPGAPEVPIDEEIARVAPVVADLRAAGVTTAISIDTRKAAVAQASLSAGADLINDVSALEFDAQMASVVAQSGAAVCLMHMRGTPETMTAQNAYDDIVLDVYDALKSALDTALAAGIARDRIVLDPGIGFAKNGAQNMALIRRLSLLHSLGQPILLGVSRKRFIGEIGQAPEPTARMPGSVAIALAGVQQGAQILRVHDDAETLQALRLWQAQLGA